MRETKISGIEKLGGARLTKESEPEKFSKTYSVRLSQDTVRDEDLPRIRSNQETLEFLAGARIANPELLGPEIDLLFPGVGNASVRFVDKAGSRLAELRGFSNHQIVGVVDFTNVNVPTAPSPIAVKPSAKLSVAANVLAAGRLAAKLFQGYLSGMESKQVLSMTPVTVVTILNGEVFDGEEKITAAQKSLALAARLSIAAILKKQAEKTGNPKFVDLVRFEFLDGNGHRLDFSDAGSDDAHRRRIVTSPPNPERINMAFQQRAGFIGSQKPQAQDGRYNFVSFLSLYIAAIMIALAPDGQENEAVVRILEGLTGRTIPTGLVKVLQEVKDPTNPWYQDYVAQALEKLSIDEYLEVAEFIGQATGGAA